MIFCQLSMRFATIFVILVSLVYSQEISFSMNSMEPPKTEMFYSREFPKAGDTLYLKVTVPQGWKINSNRVPEDFLVPSSIEAIAKGIVFDSVLWSKPIVEHNELLNMDLLLLRDTFTVALPIKFIEDNYNPYDAKLKFTYQACSKICLPPKTIEIYFNPALQKKKVEPQIKEKSSLPIYILLAFIGGLLLNAMPCVLPILFLKIFDLVKKTGESKRNMLKWGLATASGICFSFFVIALIISGLRLTGNAVGWGFQFQHPTYTAAMVLCLAIFALNLWGVFEIWMPGNVLNVWEKRTKEGGFRGAFAYGILLVLLSTPCSAPFLGTAIGFAFTATTVELFAVFAAVAIGLSFPYIILSVFPQWTKKLPRPGDWMLILKQFLGFPLLLTVAWLFWIFYRQTGPESALRLGLLLCTAGFFAWLSGILAKPGKPWLRFVLLWLVFILIYVFSWTLWVDPQIHDMSAEEIALENPEWILFSQKKLDSLQGEGIAVWVNGSAEWCITCKMNEKVVFENEEVKELFEKKKIVRMRADYTNSNHDALTFFEKYGREGVPFDLFLSSRGETILLPELLTVDGVVEILALE
ncbi:MAG: thioredoxin family protein [Fibromonadaceae bacterium]|jgi:thiol:disulfide interchange protein DsbD|nr:thioredoxin family protein [Fibromonadaceae bacterium]